MDSSRYGSHTDWSPCVAAGFLLHVDSHQELARNSAAPLNMSTNVTAMTGRLPPARKYDVYTRRPMPPVALVSALMSPPGYRVRTIHAS